MKEARYPMRAVILKLDPKLPLVFVYSPISVHNENGKMIGWALISRQEEFIMATIAVEPKCPEVLLHEAQALWAFCAYKEYPNGAVEIRSVHLNSAKIGYRVG